jgi:two-component system, chemotaxis family, chemotaxis protein CheY
MKILLVDDSKMMRTIQKTTLKGLGNVEFAEADDGQDALTIIGSTVGGFNLILVDWNMPNMDGLTLITRIRATDKKTPLIMVTTEAEKSRVMEALKAGANNYVIKPFKGEMLLDKVVKTLAKAA